MMDEKFWLAIAFVSFILIFLKYVWPKLAKALDSKSRQIAEEILAAKEMREKATILLEEAEKYQEESMKRAKKLLSDAEDEAKKFALEAQKTLEEEIIRKTQSATQRIKIEEEMAIRKIKTDIINSAVKQLGDDLAKGIDAKQQQDLIDKALGKL